jgi:outer membrane protein assembly complex protein YaeT
MRFFRVILLLAATVLTTAAETSVRITGMRAKSEQQMLAMVGGRLTHIKASPATPPLADDAAFILRQLLENDGYTGATVDWKIKGRDEVELVVSEGIRFSLGNVSVSGVDGEDVKKFARIYAKPAEVGREIGGEAPPFREEDVETGLSYLRQELNARGYWQAEASVTKRDINSETGVVDLSIDVRPGLKFRIGRATASVNDRTKVAPAMAVAHSYTGRSATTQNLNAMRLAVEESVASIGYPDARILMSRTLSGSEFIPSFSTVLGERVKLRNIAIEGLERTQPERVARRVRGMEGDWYDSAEMNLRLRQFLATGAFSSARVERSPAGEGTVDVTLHFEEAKAREFTLSGGAGSYQGIILRSGYTDRNLFGKLMGLNAGLEMSFLGLLGDVRVIDPWVFGSDVSAMARAYALIYSREGYKAYETGLEGQLTWKYGEHYRADLLAGYSIASLSEDGLPSSVLGEKNYTHPRLRLTQALDFRDNPVLPKSGWHLESPLEIGSAIGNATTSYMKGGLSGGWYHKLNRHYDIGIGGEFGMIIPSGDDLPIDLRLFNGGARSVRSFPERELGPEVNGYPTGGEATWNTNFELVRKISDSVGVVAFVDAGALSLEYEDIVSAKLNLATGLGLRLNLPIGPVRFEYGYNLTRDEGEPAGAFHFAIGTAY